MEASRRPPIAACSQAWPQALSPRKRDESRRSCHAPGDAVGGGAAQPTGRICISRHSRNQRTGSCHYTSATQPMLCDTGGQRATRGISADRLRAASALDRSRDELLTESRLLLRIPMGGRPQFEARSARQDDAFHFERSSPRRRDRTAAQSSRDVGSFTVSCAAIELRKPRSVPLRVAVSLDAVEQLSGKGQPLVRRKPQRFLEIPGRGWSLHAVDFSLKPAWG